MGKKSIILTLTPFYLPGFKGGGPVRTIANLVERLGDELDFRIVTSDRDMCDDQPYTEVKVDAWNPVGNAQVFYASASRCCFFSLVDLIQGTPHEVLYLNGFFPPVFTIRPLLARRLGLLPKRPIVLAPRGEFSDGALSLKRPKKILYMTVSHLLGLYKDLTWQASSDRELDNIKRAMGKTAQSIFVAMDLPSNSNTFTRVAGSKPRQPGDRALRVCFLSRIAPMKNLDFALKILAKVSAPVEFNIFGPIEDEKYWRGCQNLMKKLPDNIKVTYGGEVEHAQVVSTIGEHDLFFFPTRGENFGHVITEALLAGTPVLISNQTPWQDLEKEDLGWDVPLEAEAKIVEIIEKMASEPVEAHEARKLRVRASASIKLTDQTIVQANLDLFRRLSI